MHMDAPWSTPASSRDCRRVRPRWRGRSPRSPASSTSWPARAAAGLRSRSSCRACRCQSRRLTRPSAVGGGRGQSAMAAPRSPCRAHGVRHDAAGEACLASAAAGSLRRRPHPARMLWGLVVCSALVELVSCWRRRLALEPALVHVRRQSCLHTRAVQGVNVDSQSCTWRRRRIRRSSEGRARQRAERGAVGSRTPRLPHRLAWRAVQPHPTSHEALGVPSVAYN
mmetsp:Transcript_2554/g.5156  ORF Transcript_2554/g.5156 Transcript_2554/m.5156 type:complete len:225 (+) Transcript_2554:691-1365(+)